MKIFSHSPPSPEPEPYHSTLRYTELVLYDDMKGDISIVSQRHLSEEEWSMIEHYSSRLVYCPTYDENHRATTHLLKIKVISPDVKLEAYDDLPA